MSTSSGYSFPRCSKPSMLIPQPKIAFLVQHPTDVDECHSFVPVPSSIQNLHHCVWTQVLTRDGRESLCASLLCIITMAPQGVYVYLVTLGFPYRPPPLQTPPLSCLQSVLSSAVLALCPSFFKPSFPASRACFISQSIQWPVAPSSSMGCSPPPWPFSPGMSKSRLPGLCFSISGFLRYLPSSDRIALVYWEASGLKISLLRRKSRWPTYWGPNGEVIILTITHISELHLRSFPNTSEKLCYLGPMKSSRMYAREDVQGPVSIFLLHIWGNLQTLWGNLRC